MGGGGERVGMEVEGEGDYIPIATLSPPEWFLHKMRTQKGRLTSK